MTSLLEHNSSHWRIKMPLVNIIGQQRCCLGLLFVFLVRFILLSPQVQASTNNSNPSVEFSDNGTLTLSAEAVTLETLLEKIKEKSSMEFEIPEKLLKQPISVSFKSLPLDNAIRRVLRGVSYSCIFDSNGNMQKVVVLPNAREDKDNHVARRDGRLDFPHERAMEITPPPEPEDIMEAMESMTYPELKYLDEAVEVTPPPEVVKDLVEAIKSEGGTPPPELEELMEAMENMPSHGEGEMDEPVETTPAPEVGDQVEAMKSAGGTPPPELEGIMEAMENMPSPEFEELDKAAEIKPPPEVVKSLVEAIRASGETPPPELEDMMEAMGIVSPPEKKNP